MSRTPVIVSWSGGKDCVLALERLRRDDRWDVRGLVTTITADERRVCMHEVPERWLQRQAEELGLPLQTIPVPRWPSNEVYRAAWERGVESWRAAGVQTVAFGDLFLEDIRAYRETLCAGLGVSPAFPLWGLETSKLAREFIESGYGAIVCCVDESRLTADFVGCRYDASFLDRLPAEVDLCGERGEFHTFVTSGPGWRQLGNTAAGTITRSAGFVWWKWCPEDAAGSASRVEHERVREFVNVW